MPSKSDFTECTNRRIAIEKTPGLWVTGMGSQYPPYVYGNELLEDAASKYYDVENPSMKKLLEINRHTGIDSRPIAQPWDTDFGSGTEPPSIAVLDAYYRKAGVGLAVQACRKALHEWGGDMKDITHTIAVTCTNVGNPGFDLLVAQELGLSDELDRMLLHGVGCAGGLATMRAAAQIASAASLLGRPARILAFACELCSLNMRSDLNVTVAKNNPDDTNIAPALFSDAAAAYILCNEWATEVEDKAIFKLVTWGNAIVPGTQAHMRFEVDPLGWRTTLTREVPRCAVGAIGPMLDRLLPSFRTAVKNETLEATDFDWALHPGGAAILQGTRKSLQLSEEHLRASHAIYKGQGNSSSPTALIVLDTLRNPSMGGGRDNIVATAFGPGLAIEMVMFQRCRNTDHQW